MYPSCHLALSGPERVRWREWLVWTRGQHRRPSFQWRRGSWCAERGGEWRTGAVRVGGTGGAGGVDVESSSRHAIRPGVRIHYKKGLSLTRKVVEPEVEGLQVGR